MKLKCCLFFSLLLLGASVAFSQNKVEKMLRDSLDGYFSAYVLPGYGHFGKFKTEKVVLNASRRSIDIYPSDAFCSQPFTPDLVDRVYRDVKQTLPKAYRKYEVRLLTKNKRRIERLIPNYLRKERVDSRRLWGKIHYKGTPWVTPLSRPYTIERGLNGRHLMVNASHGRYYKLGKWRWQRPYLFCTTEDLLTHSFVYPYLIPMLERAGAVVLTARERDPQELEAVVDNDALQTNSTPAEASTASAPANCRGRDGWYQEVSHDHHAWHTADVAGFAMPKACSDTCMHQLTDSIRPFTLGTVRQVTTASRGKKWSEAVWTPQIPQTGSYAVYVSYASLPESVDDAHYTVYHKGGRTQFLVNQQMGGGTWVYLGTFDFDAGENFSGRVVLSNESRHRGVVTADAVRFGGGRGQIARDTIGTSQLPRFLEGARYHAAWSGVPDSLYVISDGTNDYTDDIRARSAMLNHAIGGSLMDPHTPGWRVPIEMCIGVHSDAGYKADSIYGSMAICTTEKKDGTVFYPSGISRSASFDWASRTLSDVQRDLSATYGIEWFRREMWDRNYGESRTPNVPAIIYETLSHQNYTDLKYAHDPNFKFTLARALYKALLRQSYYMHNNDNACIQPLAPRNFSALLSENEKEVTLSWEATLDELEPTAMPNGYVVYTRTNGEGFDNGHLVERGTTLTLSVQPNVRYDFKVTAVNDGGESMPSEVLSVYRSPGKGKKVLIVNGFTRLSGPARIEKADSIGFDIDADLGVPYHYTASFAGRQVCFDTIAARSEGPGAWGYCTQELEGRIIGGNTFDYAARHGAAIAASGSFSYSSISKGALKKGDADMSHYDVVDYIAGAEKDAPHNLLPYKSLDEETRSMLKGYLLRGGALLLSGSYVGSDLQTKEERDFARWVLKYSFVGSASADSTNYVNGLNLTIPYHRGLTRECYPLQAPDAIAPTSERAFTAFVYGGGQSAGVAYRGNDYRVLTMGFPFESIADATIREQAIEAILRFLTE